MPLRDSMPSANLLDAVAHAFAYPGNGIAATLEPLILARNAGFEGVAPQLAAATDEVLDASGCFADRTAEQLAYTRLFIGSLEMLAPPYASYYTTENHTLNGRIAAEVEAVYSQFGIRLGDDEIAPPDHLRYLLTFLSLLAARYEETGEEAFADAYVDFRDAYIVPWYGQFQELVDAHADAPYYPALVALVGRIMGV